MVDVWVPNFVILSSPLSRAAESDADLRDGGGGKVEPGCLGRGFGVDQLLVLACPDLKLCRLESCSIRNPWPNCRRSHAVEASCWAEETGSACMQHTSLSPTACGKRKASPTANQTRPCIPCGDSGLARPTFFHRQQSIACCCSCCGAKGERPRIVGISCMLASAFSGSCCSG